MWDNKKNKDLFKFEREGLDFPFYNNTPELSTFKWIILVIGVVISLLFVLIPKPQIPQNIISFINFLIPFLTFMYVGSGKIGLICKKFQKSDLLLMLGCYLADFFYGFLMIVSLFLLGVSTNVNAVLNQTHDILFWVAAPLQIFGEELVKLFIFLIVLFLVYKYTNNRKVGVIVATLVSLVIFGLAHYNSYGNFIQMILVIGLGSFFTTFAYLVTKNVLTSYILHLASNFLNIGVLLSFLHNLVTTFI